MIVINNPAPGTFETAEGKWTLVEDPPHDGLGAVAIAGSTAMLGADGAVPSAADIGYASVNGQDAMSSTGGFYFDPNFDFSVAIDFVFSANSSLGAGGIGFGIGEDINGSNSAGVGLGFVNGSPLLFATAGRVGDVNQPLESITSGFGIGRLFVEYDSASGDVIVGVNATQGTPAPSVFKTIAGIQDLWDDEPLLVSFFLRSQAASPFPSLTSGSVQSAFSNFEVLNGTPISVPEPNAALLAGAAFMCCLSRRR
ncbi:hypothetical protein [Botrimarina colliarenosi]|uniref:hypothetical protein n=1 Tax=Botrimarina colliarenosi TaxID=2528001 RepID=UPI0011B80A28|nr:hypothetical protein [Botrimarina colliarenosi]